MRSLSVRAQWTIGIVLALLMAATCGYHFVTIEHLPSASWAAFFIAGMYLGSRLVFPALLAEAALLDFAAITWGGVSNFCVTPAYGFLLPAYSTLWVAGIGMPTADDSYPIDDERTDGRGGVRSDFEW
jgi:hypothetical protein